MATVILSSNQNLDYLFYAPLTAKVWNHFGFKALNFVVGKSEIGDFINKTMLEKTNSEIYELPESNVFRSDTLSQFCRMYGACVVEDENEYVLLGDIDLIPLNSYTYRDFDKMNIINFDLTDRTEVPVCHVGMYVKKWRELLNLKYGNVEEQINRDLELMSHKSKSKVWEEYWNTDQDFLTKKIKDFGFDKFNFIDRGREPSGYAYRRVDRGNWNWSKDIEYIDSHMLRNPYSDENFNKTFDLIQYTLKNVDCSWMKEYHTEFKKLIGA